MSRYTAGPLYASRPGGATAARDPFPPNAPGVGAPLSGVPSNIPLSVGVPVGTSSFALGGARTVVRGAPVSGGVLGAPRLNSDAIAGGISVPLRAVPLQGGGAPPAAAGGWGAAGGGAPASTATAGSGPISEALRQRTARVLGVDVPFAGGAQAELASRGIAATFDPSAGAPAAPLPRAPAAPLTPAALPPRAPPAAAVPAAPLPREPQLPPAPPPPPAAEMNSSAELDAGDDADFQVAPMPPLSAGGGGGGGGGGGAVPRTLSDPTPTGALELGENIRGFLTTPVPRAAGVVRCYIKRENTGNFLTKFLTQPVFSMHLTDNDRFLLAGTKRAANKTSNYLVSMDKRDLARDSAAFLGKVRANFLGTEFQLYDDGESPDARDKSGALRQELGVVCFTPNVMGSRGPRKMRVAIPKVSADGRVTAFRPAKEDDSMLKKFDALQTADLFTLINKPPKWNEQVGAYVLNFGGRVTVASVKNFQLVQPEEMETVALQFGRVEKELFNMDFQWPLSPLQAFSISLAAFVRTPPPPPPPPRRW
jgi:tubby-related protein 1